MSYLSSITNLVVPPFDGPLCSRWRCSLGATAKHHGSCYSCGGHSRLCLRTHFAGPGLPACAFYPNKITPSFARSDEEVKFNDGDLKFSTVVLSLLLIILLCSFGPLRHQWCMAKNAEAKTVAERHQLYMYAWCYVSFLYVGDKVGRGMSYIMYMYMQCHLADAKFY